MGSGRWPTRLGSAAGGSLGRGVGIRLEGGLRAGGRTTTHLGEVDPLLSKGLRLAGNHFGNGLSAVCLKLEAEHLASDGVVRRSQRGHVLWRYFGVADVAREEGEQPSALAWWGRGAAQQGCGIKCGDTGHVRIGCPGNAKRSLTRRTVRRGRLRQQRRTPWAARPGVSHRYHPKPSGVDSSLERAAGP